MALDPALLSQFQVQNPKFMEAYRQNQEEQNAEQPSQAISKPPEPPSSSRVPHRPYRPSISGGRLFHTRPFSHLGRKK
jgi:hypothetical protein